MARNNIRYGYDENGSFRTGDSLGFKRVYGIPRQCCGRQRPVTGDPAAGLTERSGHETGHLGFKRRRICSEAFRLNWGSHCADSSFVLFVVVLAVGGWLAWTLESSSVQPSSPTLVLLRPGYSSRRIAFELRVGRRNPQRPRISTLALSSSGTVTEGRRIFVSNDSADIAKSMIGSRAATFTSIR